ncbi:MAG: cytochrome c [Myxococcota bacterium]
MRTFVMILAVGLVGCGDGAGDRTDAILALTGDAAKGETVYADNCAVCHAASGLGENDPTSPGTGEDLTEAASEVGEDAEIISYILEGAGDMTAFGDILDDQQVADLLAYMHDGLIQ